MDYPGKVITKTQVTPTQTSASGNWTLDDQAAAIKNNNWPVALVPNPISKSLRFNSADSAYLNRTLTTPTDGKRWTYSFWIKRVSFATNQPVLTAYTDANNQATLYHTTGNKLYWLSTTGGTTYTQFRTDAVYRDASAWYHFVVVFDSTNATSTDRIKMYVNGTSLTCEAGQYIAPGLNTTAFVNTAIGHRIGNDQNLGIYLNGYLTEVNFIDGQALTPSDFGLTNPQTGQWIPKKYTGTYGTNGFYLNFKDATSTTTLGYDYSGNANNWTTNNFSVTAGSGNDSLTDVPTPWVAYNTTGDVGGVIRGNYATWNGALPATIAGPSIATISNGNLDVALLSNVVGDLFLYSTTLLSSGKWYYEFTISATTNNGHGIGASGASFSQLSGNSYAIYRWQSGVVFVNTGNVTTGLPTCTTNDVIGVAIDVGAGTIQWFKNNTSLYTATGLTYSTYIPLIYGDAGTGRTFSGTTNFGQRPFAYTPPAGFRSLCTTNLPATTIGFGLTNQGDDYFNANLYTGTGSAFTLTGVGFQPDFGWFKGRNASSSHWLHDVVRGANPGLSSNNDLAEDTTAGQLTSFASDGYSLPNDTAGYLNLSGRTMVVWSWKAGGAGVTNTAGTITSTVSANTTSGFSVVTWTGTGSTGTVGHGLSSAPFFIIAKRRNAITNWQVYHKSLTASNQVCLNLANASFSTTTWNSTEPTSSVFSIDNVELGANGATMVAYCFAAVAGYSAFGSYTGNGSTDGPFTYTGFRPRYILIKRTDVANDWYIQDTATNTYNVVGNTLLPNSSAAEASYTLLDILSNGFKQRSIFNSHNASGGTYIYAAFAEYPFQFANAR